MASRETWVKTTITSSTNVPQDPTTTIMSPTSKIYTQSNKQTTNMNLYHQKNFTTKQTKLRGLLQTSGYIDNFSTPGKKLKSKTVTTNPLVTTNTPDGATTLGEFLRLKTFQMLSFFLFNQ